MRRPDPADISTSLFAPKSWHGTIVRLEKTPEGGAVSKLWKDGAWADGPDVGKIMSLPDATPAELLADGMNVFRRRTGTPVGAELSR
jgi:hypothetical protein